MAASPKKYLLQKTALVCLLSAPLAANTNAQDAGSSITLTGLQNGESISSSLPEALNSTGSSPTDQPGLPAPNGGTLVLSGNNAGSITLSGYSPTSGIVGGGNLLIATGGDATTATVSGGISLTGNGSLYVSSNTGPSLDSLSLGSLSVGSVQWSAGGALTLSNSNTGLLTSNFSGTTNVTEGTLNFTGGLVITGGGISSQYTNSSSLSVNGSAGTLTLSGSSIRGGALESGWNSIVILDPQGLPLTPVPSQIPPLSAETAAKEVTVESGSGIVLKTAANLVASGSVSFQWLKDGMHVQGANSATLVLPSTSTDSGGSYTLSINTPAGTIVTPATRLNIKPRRTLAFVQEAPALVKTLRGAAATLPMYVSSDVFGGGATTFQLFQKPAGAGGQLKPLPLSGRVDAAGVLQVPLSKITESGDYVVKIERTYADVSAPLSVESRAFTIQMDSWDSLVGSYEALLGESTPNLGPADGATYRGLVSFSLTKTGSLSGRLQYNEMRLDAANPNGLTYTAVTQPFAGSMTAAPGETQKFVFTPKLLQSATRPKLTVSVEIDMTALPASVQVKVQDKSSTGSEAVESGFQSRAANLKKTLSQAPRDLPAGSRFILTSQTVSSLGFPNLGFPSETGYITAQIAPGGKVLWSSRLPGYSGTGSASLTPAEGAGVCAALYEGRTVSSPKLFSTNSLLGQLNFQPDSAGSPWTATLGSDLQPACMERQHTKIVRTPPAASVAGAAPVSEVSRISFDPADSCFWPGSRPPVAPFLPTGAPLELSLKDTSLLDTNGQPTSHTWMVTLSTRGTTTVSGVPRNGVLPPQLILRFDRDRGEWSGGYMLPGNVKRTLFGAASPCRLDHAVRSAGWVEDTTGSNSAPGMILWKLTAPEPGTLNTPPSNTPLSR